jgi:hypothetical protein
VVDTEPRNSSERSHDGWLLRVIWSPDTTAINEVVRLTDSAHRIDRAHSRGAPVLVVQDPAISKGCVTVQPAPGGLEVIDNGSRNPVRVNQEVVRRQQLRANDVLRVGDTVFVTELDHPARQVAVEAPEGDDRIKRLRTDLFLVQSTEAWRVILEALLLGDDLGTIGVAVAVPGDAVALAEWLAGGPESTVTFISGDPGTYGRQLQSVSPSTWIAIDCSAPLGEHELTVHDAIRARRRAGSEEPVVFALPWSDDTEQADSRGRSLVSFDYAMELVPLHQRRVDIGAAIVETARSEGRVEALDAGFLERAITWSWTGGIVELRTQLSRIRRLFRSGRALDGARWPFDSSIARPSGPMNASGVRAMAPEAFAEVFAQHGGNLAHVAAALGVSRTWLYKALPDIGIDIHGLRTRGNAPERNRNTRKETS